MKRLMIGALLVCAVAASGCQSVKNRGSASPGGAGGYAGNGSGYAPANVYGGPASPQVTYPYYTTRGPRDFLASDPPSIGR